MQINLIFIRYLGKYGKLLANQKPGHFGFNQLDNREIADIQKKMLKKTIKSVPSGYRD